MLVRFLPFVFLLPAFAAAQPNAQKSAEHLIGTVTAIDSAAQTVTVKQDKNGTEYTARLGETKTILSVPPGTKPADLRQVARRITAADIHQGDRIELYYSADATNGNTIAPRAAVVMSGSALEAARAAEAEAWQHSTVGVVASVDPTAQILSIIVRTPEGSKPMTLTASPSTQFTRYSVASPKSPAAANFSDIQPGDILRVIGETSPDGTTMAAQKVYIAPRQLPAVVVSNADGKLVVKDLRNKQNVTVEVTPQTQIHKLPLPIAYALARRLNPSFRGAPAAGRQAGSPSSESSAHYGPPSGEARGTGAPEEAGAARPQRMGGMAGAAIRGPGDLSRLIENSPAIAVTDLKPGDAIVISGAPEPGGSGLIASTIVAGVDPIFQSAPPREGQSLGNWSLDMSVPSTE
jgi:hypothetical protein